MARRSRRNRRRSRGRFAFLYRLLCFVLICAAIVGALVLFFKVDTISVSGNDRYSRETILAASGVSEGDNLFLLNKYDAAARITEALPYVESVSILRGLPSTITASCRGLCASISWSAAIRRAFSRTAIAGLSARRASWWIPPPRPQTAALWSRACP